jgi:transposase
VKQLDCSCPMVFISVRICCNGLDQLVKSRFGFAIIACQDGLQVTRDDQWSASRIGWRDLPERFGNFRVRHTWHTRWSRSGVWQRIFEVRAADADNEYAMIDSTSVGAHQHSAGAKKGGQAEAIGRSRGGLSTKIHATVDALGNPTGFHLTPGQAHDLEGAGALLPDTPAATIIADKAYDAQERVIAPLHEAGKHIAIASRPCRT